MLNSFAKVMLAPLIDKGTYDTRKVDRTELNDKVIVSTAFTSDQGYETAILLSTGTHPVERYPDIHRAMHGHKKWCEKLPSMKSITELGYDDICDSQEISLKGQF